MERGPGDGAGVLGSTVTGHGVYGLASASSGVAIGSHGQSNSSSGYGVIGEALSATGSTYGAYGVSHSPNGTGVYGYALATTSNNRGVFGRTDSNAGVAVVGFAASASGSPGGVLGITSAPSGYGVYGESFAGTGVGYGVRGFAQSANGYAGYFSGRFHVQGTLTKTGGTFLIDHPQDPANKTLEPSFVEAAREAQRVPGQRDSLDTQGQRDRSAARYFRALNTEYSYQLTPSGAGQPVLYIAREIEPGGDVPVAGGNARPEGVLAASPALVRTPGPEATHSASSGSKRRKDRGTYLNPEAFGRTLQESHASRDQAQDASSPAPLTAPQAGPLETAGGVARPACEAGPDDGVVTGRTSSGGVARVP